MPACAGCSNKVVDGRFLNCINCHKFYDLLCANISQEMYSRAGPEEKTSWKCVQCKSVEPKRGNAETPVRGGNVNINMNGGAGRPRVVASPEESEGDSSIMEVSYVGETGALISRDSQHHRNTTPPGNGLDATRVTDIQLLTTELRLFREEMRAMSHEIHALREAMSGLALRIDGCDGRISALCARVELLESKPETRADNGDPEAMLSTIGQLRMELNDRDQDMLLNDIEVSCVPERSGENPLHLITTLGQKLGVALAEHDIVDAVRVGRASRLEEGVQGPASRPRLLVVRLARRAVRDSLLQAARVRRGATTEGTGMPGPSGRFYVNERLTPNNRRLFQKAREHKDRLNWRYAWTRDGRVYVRQRPGTESPRYRIRTEQDLTRVFGVENV
ncbi:uncharacterized protein [Choristoneura fumiferana]|uniref:uncharacterized protein n=1 Tax=Choristoneura fumiferana TaxID=7141 RepID=UPI003D159D8C